ncbi:hypothetical protein [Clostridium estertheticum]|uniref:hypothetical protein n=1 Tax=Clostridium estertheticum TaxID=238834 RepID=UPI001C0B320E|nr:hypothetical protein [Clostridium estertheticum]MBU3183824.1 hypothetical protein [Clostridium estertheticum]
MIKKLIAYQKLLLNSNPPFPSVPPTFFNVLLYCLAFVIIVFMNISLFIGDTMSSSTFIPFTLPIIILWMINRIFHGDPRLFESVPVSRKYVALNMFLLPIVMIFIMYIMIYISGAVLIGTIIGIISLTSSQGTIKLPAESILQQVIDTTKGDMLMLCILLITVFVGVAITFIKNKKLRLTIFAGFATIVYGLLFFLKLTMPISPITGKVEFLESFSIMPHAGTILLFVAIATVIISITSVLIGHKLYVGKSTSSKCY